MPICDVMRSSLLYQRRLLFLGVLSLSAVTGADARAAPQSILTHHYDSLRTGWNPNETILTPATVPGLQLLTSVSLDEQIDAQPLLVPGLAIAGGTHDVLYVATENDTVYALDAATGANLLPPKNFGTPAPQSVLPGQCNNNSGNVGINSTPVIDPASSTMYVMVYSYENGAPIYRLHALDLTTLSDKVPAAVVSASAKLSRGGVYNFNPSVSRQRSGLLLAPNGNIYAGFASFCDINANLSRGWLLGWQPGSGKLTPLAANHLDDQQANSTDTFFSVLDLDVGLRGGRGFIQQSLFYDRQLRL
jgi:outer membrane protein assembly factor BamB